MFCGIIAQINPCLHRLDVAVKNKFSHGTEHRIKIDDLSKFAGTTGVFVLDAVGILLRIISKNEYLPLLFPISLWLQLSRQRTPIFLSGVRIALKTIPFHQDIRPRPLWGQNSFGKNIVISLWFDRVDGCCWDRLPADVQQQALVV